MSNTPRDENIGNLQDRLEGLEFSVGIARQLAEVSPEREDLVERIVRLEAEINEIIEQLRSRDDTPGVDAA